MARPRKDTHRVKCSFTLDKEIIEAFKFIAGENMSRALDDLIFNYLVKTGMENSYGYYSAKLGMFYLYSDGGIYYFADENNDVVEELGRHRSLLSALQAYRKLVDSEEE